MPNLADTFDPKLCEEMTGYTFRDMVAMYEDYERMASELEAIRNIAEKHERCRNCKHYDPSPFPEYNGKLALCRGESWQYKIGINTLAGTCFERRHPNDPN